MTIPASVAVISKNEENNIEEALKSVEDFEDIVVVDSGSQDRTVEICKKYTDRVYQHEWRGFASQKQKAVDYCKNQWVLILDADERVPPELKSEILESIRNTSISGFYLPRKNFFLGKWIRHGGWWPDRTLRLFRKDVSHVEEREVHEKIVVKGALGCLKNPLEHYTYRTLSDYVGKMELYSTLSANELSNGTGRTSAISAVVNPCFVFVKMFFLRQGFRDGMHGFLLAVLYSFYTFLKYAKVWEKEGRR